MSPIYRSFAKINLHLQVVGRRADGYHELRTVFQTVADHDRVRVELTDGEVSLTVSEGEVEAGEGNLALRAARAFFENWRLRAGARIELSKRLPVGAGLGGGSSNAATVLMALAELTDAEVEPLDLWRIARNLGADVPFFLLGGTALGIGRGDELIALPELPETVVWLVTPPVAIATGSVFSALGPDYDSEMAPELMLIAKGAAVPSLNALRGRNDLASMVFSLYPEVASVYNALLEAGAESVGLSGSGSTVFACFDGQESPGSWVDRLPVGSRVVRTTTISRAKLQALRIVEERGTTRDGDY